VIHLVTLYGVGGRCIRSTGDLIGQGEKAM